MYVASETARPSAIPRGAFDSLEPFAFASFDRARAAAASGGGFG
jgi:hypothetical protein